MNRIISFLTVAALWLTSCQPATAGTVSGNLTNANLAGFKGSIWFIPTNLVQQVGAATIVNYEVKTNVANGVFTNFPLVTGWYAVKFRAVTPANAESKDYLPLAPMLINMPNDNLDHNIYDISTNVTTFTYDKPPTLVAVTGSGGSATTNSLNLVTINLSGGSGTVPTSTGFYHITGGVADAAARALVIGDIPALGSLYATLASTNGFVGREVTNGLAYAATVATKAPLVAPSFTGGITLDGSITLADYDLGISQDELLTLFGVTSAIQPQLDARATLAYAGLSPTNLSANSEPLGNNAFADMTGATPAKKGQIGVSYSSDHFMHLWIADAPTLGHWTNGWNFIGGIKTVGDADYGDPSINSTHWILNGGPAGNAIAGDSLFTVENGSTNDHNSGAGFNLGVAAVSAAGKAIEVGSHNSAAWLHIPTNRIASLAPGNVAMAYNSGTSLKNFMINSPGVSGFDSGSYPFFDVDLIDHSSRFPIWKSGVYQPGDTPYVFTVSGVSVAPIAFDVYSHNGTLWVITAISLTGTAPNKSGTIAMTPFPTKAATASGTLTRVSSSGDSTITFGSSVAASGWVDALYISPVTGNVQVHSNLFVTNNINLRSATASKVLVSDASKNITSSSTTSTELGYVSGVTSAIQTQLNGKAAVSTTKVYRALLTQSGAAAPVATVLENSLGGTVVWTRVGTGQYVGTLAGAFTANKTFVQHVEPADLGVFSACVRASADTITLQTADNGLSYTDDELLGASVGIFVNP